MSARPRAGVPGVGVPDVDVLVVGGGPVGLAAAIEARLSGLSATVLEPRRTPIDKACGEGLMPGAVAALRRLGVHPAGWELSGISYQRVAAAGGRYRADHRFLGGTGLGVRRTVLHAALAARAAELGVSSVATKVNVLGQDEHGVVAAGIRARWLLGCDGLHSSVSALAGLDAPARGIRRFGLRRHFAVAPWSSFVEVRWLPDSEVYITPIAADLVGVAVLGPAHTDYAKAIAAVPELGGAAAGPLRGAGPFRRRTVRRVAGRVLLAGDASGYVDAITGEGIRVGLAQARATIACIVAGDPERYERDWRRATGDFRRLTGGVLALAASPLRPATVPLAQRLPSLFGAVVERLAR